MEIKKTLITDEELKKEYNITIPSEIIVLKADEEIAELQKTYKMNGFRPGKVPVNIIKEKEWTYVFSKACENAINDIVYNIIEENKYDLSYKPSISIKTMEDNKDVEFSVVYELLPNIDNIKLEDITIDKYEANITDKDIDKSIKNILSSYKNWEKKDDTAKLGDSVKINFVGTINGEEFEGGKAEDYQLELGSHSFIDNFEDQIVGKKAGDKIDVNVTFPDNYHKSSLAGKPALFKVEIIEVLEPKERELTDEFVKTTFGTANTENFKELIKKELNDSCENNSKVLARRKIVDKLIDMVNFNLPERMLKEQIDNIIKYKQKENIKNSKKDPVTEDEVKDDAKDLVKINLIISKIGRDNNITANDNEVTKAVMKNAMSVPGYEKQIIDYYKKNYSAVAAIKDEITRMKVLDFVLDKINKNIIKISVDELEKLVKNQDNNV